MSNDKFLHITNAVMYRNEYSSKLKVYMPDVVANDLDITLEDYLDTEFIDIYIPIDDIEGIFKVKNGYPINWKGENVHNRTIIRLKELNSFGCNSLSTLDEIMVCDNNKYMFH